MGALYPQLFGLVLGSFTGYELSHNKKEGFFVSVLVMALSGASHFTYAHVYNHHLDLGHEDDPATAPRGRNVYWHTRLSHAGQSKFSYDMERKKLAKQGKGFLHWQNKWLLGYLYSLPSVVLYFGAGGLVGLLALAAVWVLSNFLLEALNFMGHYGLIRETVSLPNIAIPGTMTLCSQAGSSLRLADSAIIMFGVKPIFGNSMM